MDNQRLLLHPHEIAQRISELGERISADYDGKKPLFLVVLNGAFVFAADLLRACSLECEVAFIRLASYAGTQSTGIVSTVLGLTISLENRHVIVVEDIIDSGRTLHHLLPELESQRPATLKLAVLLLKPEALQFALRPDYLAFEIQNIFVVGYGLDFNGLYRNLAGIYQVVDEKPS